MSETKTVDLVGYIDDERVVLGVVEIHPVEGMVTIIKPDLTPEERDLVTSGNVSFSIEED